MGELLPVGSAPLPVEFTPQTVGFTLSNAGPAHLA